MISKSKIDKIGTKVKNGRPLTAAETEQLLSWRNSFFDTLEAYHKRVREKLDMTQVVSVGKRLKRIPSIHTKLKNSDSLRLSTMQDIAGLRVVLRDQASLYEDVNIIRSSNDQPGVLVPIHKFYLHRKHV